MEWRYVVQFGPPPEVPSEWSFGAVLGIVLGCIWTYIFIAKLLATVIEEKYWPDKDQGFAAFWPFVLAFVLPPLLRDRLQARNLPKATVINK